MPIVSACGRVPITFWTIVAGALFTLGCALADSLETYYPMRALQSFSLASGFTAGLAFIADMFYFHERARKIGIWTSMWLAAPYFGPMIANFMVTRLGHWRYVFYLTLGMNVLSLLLILVFFDETWYRRDIEVSNQPQRGARLLRILGLWQLRHHKDYFGNTLHGYKRLLVISLKPLVIPVGVST